jgi:hypothetical protein
MMLAARANFHTLFPLTPTLSLGEREKHLAALVSGVTSVGVPWPRKRNLLSLVSATGIQHGRAPTRTERGCVSETSRKVNGTQRMKFPYAVFAKFHSEMIYEHRCDFAVRGKTPRIIVDLKAHFSPLNFHCRRALGWQAH